MLNEKRKSFISENITNVNNNDFWKALRDTIGQQICNDLPDHLDTKKLADDFNDFFNCKTENIRRAIEETSLNLEHVQPKDAFVLSVTSEKQLSDVLIQLSESTSPIDPVLTKVQKNFFKLI